MTISQNPTPLYPHPPELREMGPNLLSALDFAQTSKEKLGLTHNNIAKALVMKPLKITFLIKSSIFAHTPFQFEYTQFDI